MADKTVQELEQELKTAQEEVSKAKNDLNALEAERDTYLEENINLKEKSGNPEALNKLQTEKKKMEDEVKEAQRKAGEQQAAAEQAKKELAESKIQLAKEKIRAEFPDVLPEWLTATDEAGMRTQAQKFAEHMKARNPLPLGSDPIKKEPMETKEVIVSAAGSAMAGVGGPGLSPTAGNEEVKEAKERLEKATEKANLDANEENLKDVAFWKMKWNFLNGGRKPIERA